MPIRARIRIRQSSRRHTSLEGTQEGQAGERLLFPNDRQALTARNVRLRRSASLSPPLTPSLVILISAHFPDLLCVLWVILWTFGAADLMFSVSCAVCSVFAAFCGYSGGKAAGHCQSARGLPRC